MIKDLNVSYETIKLLEKNRQKSLEYKHELLFSEYTSLGKGNESKNEQVGLYQTKKLLYSKGHHKQNKKAFYSMGEYIYKWHIPTRG